MTSKIKFNKIEDTPDSKAWEIIDLDGKCVGLIEAEVHNVSRTAFSPQWKVAGYTVELDWMHEAKWFERVGDEKAVSTLARAALFARAEIASRWASEAIAQGEAARAIELEAHD